MEQEAEARRMLKVMEMVLELQLRAVRQALGEEEVPPKRRLGARRQSIVDQSVQILTEAGEPLHVNELVLRLRDLFGRITDRDTLSSALAKKARQGVLLRQTDPATFGILPEVRP